MINKVENWIEAERAIRLILSDFEIDIRNENKKPNVAREETLVEIARLVTDNFCIKPKV